MTYFTFSRQAELEVNCFTSQTATCEVGNTEFVVQKTRMTTLLAEINGDCQDKCGTYECKNGGSCRINDDDVPECVCSLPIYHGEHCEIGNILSKCPYSITYCQ